MHAHDNREGLAALSSIYLILKYMPPKACALIPSRLDDPQAFKLTIPIRLGTYKVTKRALI